MLMSRRPHNGTRPFIVTQNGRVISREVWGCIKIEVRKRKRNSALMVRNYVYRQNKCHCLRAYRNSKKEQPKVTSTLGLGMLSRIGGRVMW